MMVRILMDDAVTGRLARSSLRLVAKCFDRALNELVLDFRVDLSSTRVFSSFLFVHKGDPYNLYFTILGIGLRLTAQLLQILCIHAK